MNDQFDNRDDEDDIEWVSKSQIKRDAQELVALGRQICEMSKQGQAKLPISETLAAALDEYRRIKSNEAKRRHINYVGKLLRSEDEAAVREAIDLQDPSSETYGRISGQRERWRTRLIEEGNSALTEFMAAYPNTDAQHLRQLVRNAAKEQKNNQEKEDGHKQTAAFKKLFSYIKSIDGLTE